MDSRLTTFNKQRTREKWREERDTSVIDPGGVVVSVSIYTTNPVTCSPWVLTVSTVSPPIYVLSC